MKKKSLSLYFAAILTILSFFSAVKIPAFFSNKPIIISAAAISPKTIKDSVKKALGSDYIKRPVKLSAAEINEQFGISKSLYSSAYAERPMIGNECIAIIKAKQGKTNEVKAKLEAYQKKLMNDLYQTSANVSNTAKIYSSGSYVCFLMVSDNDAALKAIKKAIK